MNGHVRTRLSAICRRLGLGILTVAAVGSLLLTTGCGDGRLAVADTGTSGHSIAPDGVAEGNALFDDSVIHEIAITYDQADYDAMIETYSDTGDKEWIEATVTIDGTTYEQVGIRLKGNSSLRGLGSADGPGGGPGAAAPGDLDAAAPAPQVPTAPEGQAPAGQAPAGDQAPPAQVPAEGQAPAGQQPAGDQVPTGPGGFPGPGFGPGGQGGPGTTASAESPETLPWLIRLDKYIAEQNHEGLTDLVVRSNNSSTALNEAVSLELLEMAGLASQDAIAVEFTVNGAEPVLRLVIEHPDDTWMADEFGPDGALYKAESTGDYSYRGTDPESYADVFDQEAGKKNADLTPLIDFLDFVNDSDDATFAAGLEDRLDVDSFATYLAMQELIDNFDDIDGPGNNSYLHYDTDTGVFTVVPWDHNLAFGILNGGGAGGLRPGAVDGALQQGAFPTDGPQIGGARGGFAPPEGFEPPAGLDGDDALGGRGPGGVSNPLVERFKAVPEFEALYEERLAELRASLHESGEAEAVLSRWVALLLEQATHLVDPETITQEAEQIASYFEE